MQAGYGDNARCNTLKSVRTVTVKISNCNLRSDFNIFLEAHSAKTELLRMNTPTNISNVDCGK